MSSWCSAMRQGGSETRAFFTSGEKASLVGALASSRASSDAPHYPAARPRHHGHRFVSEVAIHISQSDAESRRAARSSVREVTMRRLCTTSGARTAERGGRQQERSMDAERRASPNRHVACRGRSERQSRRLSGVARAADGRSATRLSRGTSRSGRRYCRSCICFSSTKGT